MTVADIPVPYPGINPPVDASEYLVPGTTPEAPGSVWLMKLGNLVVMQVNVKFSADSDPSIIMTIPPEYRPPVNTPHVMEMHGTVSGETVPIFVSASTGAVRIPSTRTGYDLRDKTTLRMQKFWLRKG